MNLMRKKNEQQNQNTLIQNYSSSKLFNLLCIFFYFPF
jgi:hypothetical protein